MRSRRVLAFLLAFMMVITMIPQSTLNAKAKKKKTKSYTVKITYVYKSGKKVAKTYSKKYKAKKNVKATVKVPVKKDYNATITPASLKAAKKSGAYKAIIKNGKLTYQIKKIKKNCTIKVTYVKKSTAPVTPPTETTTKEQETTEAPAVVTTTQDPITVETSEDPAPELTTENPDLAETSEEPASETTSEDPASNVSNEEPSSEVKMPAVTLESTKKGITVKVEAKKDTFPEGVKMVVTPVSYEKVDEIVSDVEENTIVDLVAVDISFYDGDKKVEPKKNIEVEIITPQMKKAESYKVYHIDASDNAEVVNSEAANDTGAVFKNDEFSIYAIVGTDEVDRQTYYFEDEDGNPFKFNNTAGELVDNQIVKSGDQLSDVGLPPIDAGQTFQGWYEYDKETEEYGAKIEFDTPITSIVDGKKIYVRPYFGDVAYVTFYQSSDGGNVLNKEQVVKGGTFDISQQTAPVPSSELAFVGWNTSPGEDDDSREAVTETTITVDSDVEYYPVFKKAHWISFFTAEHGQNATYIAPAIVLVGETATSKEPSDPTWRGHTFLGWSETKDTDPEASNAFTPFNFNQELSNDITLYAHWTAADTSYVVIFWKQNVTDNKNASDANKTYSFAKQEVRTGTSGQSVSPTNSDKQAETGFEFNATKSDTSVVVKADGSSVLNVYYDRQLVTYKFYKNGTNTNEPGYDNDYYNTTTGNNRVTVYTGLYGQTLEQNGYSWPSGRYNYYASNNQIIGMSFLGQFKGTEGSRGYPETRFYYTGDPVCSVRFYLQNVDGSYPTTPSDEGAGNGGRFTFTNKYDGFEVVSYRRYRADNGTAYDSNWINTENGGSVDTSYNAGSQWWPEYRYLDLHIRYERKKFNLKYLDSVDGTELSGITTKSVPYESVLTGYKPADSFVPQSKIAGKVWDGKWYKDQACTEEFVWSDKMPNADLNVYAGWEDVWYWIKIDPNGGVLSDTESTWFFETYGEKVEEYADITRNYLEDPSGTYYYHYDEFNENDPDGTQPGTRKAYYTTDASEASSTAAKYIFEQDAYTLIGWYDITNGEANAVPYNFSSEITHNLILQAKWRRAGDYKVIYSNEVVDNEGNPIKDDSGTAITCSGVPVDGNSYADQSDSVILGSPTSPANMVFQGWLYDGNIYKPSDIYKIEASLANENDEIIIYPVFSKMENLPVEVTKIIYDGNGGTTSLSTDEAKKITVNDDKTTVRYDAVQINAENTVTDQSFTRDGYKFLGWADSPDATEPKYVIDNVIGADNLDPKANTLYAVWQAKEFYIYHSGKATDYIDVVKMTKEGGVNSTKADGTYDITCNLTADTLYGGYYTNYTGKSSQYNNDGIARGTSAVYGASGTATDNMWSWNDAITDKPGNAFIPKEDTTYYVKEVPASYLNTRVHTIYYRHISNDDDAKNSNLTRIYLITGVDDYNYSGVGFDGVDKVTSGDEMAVNPLALLYDSLQFTVSANNPYDETKDAKDIHGYFDDIGEHQGVLGIYRYKYEPEDTLTTSLKFDFTPYWITPDGLKVKCQSAHCEYVPATSTGEATFNATKSERKGTIESVN